MRISHFLLIAAIIGLFGVTDCDAQKKNKTKKPTQKPPVEKPAPPATDELKFLFEDEQQGNLEEPFVFVARDAASYAELSKLFPKLPAASSIDFSKNAVVAAIAGQLPNPGYNITLQKSAGRLKIDLTSPPKDAITADVLVFPVKVVLAPIEEDQYLQIETGKHWQKKTQTFRLTRGDFEYSGGFAGMKAAFPLSGTIQILRAGGLVTAFFRLDGKQDKMIRQTTDTATGKVENGAITLWRVDPGNLVELPRPPLRATGKLGEKNLTLQFESLPTNVADGFGGKGNLEAVLAK